MLRKLRQGKFIETIATVSDVSDFVNEARRMIGQYGWQDRNVYPWGRPENVSGMIEYVADFPHCGFSSKQMLISLANGIVDVMNRWEDNELNGVAVKSIKTGKVSKVPLAILDEYLDNGFVRA